MVNIALIYISQIDFPVIMIIFCSLFICFFDCYYLSYPFMIWYIFFLLLTLTVPFNSLVLVCLSVALITEIFPLKIGSGDWLYLCLLSYSIDFLQIIYCILFASSLAIFYIISVSKKRKEIPFVPFLFLGYLLTLYLINYS